MPVITVTLRPDYLARHVALVVAKSSVPNPRARRWRIYGRDSVGALHPLVRVDGEMIEGFPTRRDAFAYVGTLAGRGAETAKIWAEPRDRRPSAYVTPADVSGGYAVQGASA